MRSSISFAAGAGMVLSLLTTPSAYAAPCAELEAWAMKLDGKAIWNLNTIDQRVRLYETFRAPEFPTLFGKSALELSDAEVKMAGDALAACAKEARAARRGVEHKMLAASQAEFARRLGPLLVQVRDAEAKLEPALASMEALPPSRALLRALDTLRHVGTPADLRPGTVIAEGRQLVTVLARLPQSTAERSQPRLEQLHGTVRAAVLAESMAAVAAVPATRAGLGDLETLVRAVKYELGPALGEGDTAALDGAADARRGDIVNALVTEAGVAIAAIPDSADGARELPRTVQRMKSELQRVATPEALASLDQIAESKRTAIDAALVYEARAAIDAGGKGFDGLVALQQTSRPQSMGSLSQASRDAITTHAAARRAAIIDALVNSATIQPDGPSGLDALAGMLRDPGVRHLNQDERKRYTDAVMARRSAIASKLLSGPIAKLATFDKNLGGMKAMVAYRNETMTPLSRHLAPAELEPFQNAFQQNVVRVGTGALPEFTKMLARVPENDKGILEIQEALNAVDGGPPAFQQAAATRRREIQQVLASTMVEQMCGEALSEAKVSKGDAKQPILGLGGNIMTLGEFVCRLKVAEQKLNDYKSPGLFGKEHLIKVTARDGAYLTFTLHEAEVVHGKKALVAFKVADANAEKPLSVQEWEAHLFALLPYYAVVPLALNDCEALFDKPDSQVNHFDQARMFDCLMAFAKSKE